MSGFVPDSKPASLKKHVDTTRSARTELVYGSMCETQDKLIRATFGATRRFTAKEKDETDLYRYVPRVRPTRAYHRSAPFDQEVGVNLRKKERQARRSTGILSFT